MVVKWSACLPSTTTIRVLILLKPIVFSVKFVLEENENEQKEAEVGPFKKLNKNGPGSKSSFAVIRVRFVGY